MIQAWVLSTTQRRGWTDSRKGSRAGRRVGFPRFKKKGKAAESFRLRNKHPKHGKPCIRLGDNGIARSVTLPGIGAVRVHDDTSRLRRMLVSGRGKILFAKVSRRGGRWFVSLNVEAADLHPAQQHGLDAGGTWVGVDRGLHDLAVTREKKGSSKHHLTIRNRRHHALHEIANVLTQHPQVALEDLNIAGMLGNHHLAASISDSAWAELARIIGYKQAWKNGTVITADRWFPSSKTCSACGDVRETLTLAERVFRCECGFTADRDLNAAVNIAAWARSHAPDPQAAGRVTNARREESSGRSTACGETSLNEAGTRHAAA